jgi:hypothetical protein
LWLVVFSVVDVLALALPLSPTMPEWRYSLIEVMSRSLMTPMLGLFGILLLASVFNHEGMLRALRVLAWIGAGLLVVALGIFIVDSMGLRGEVRRGMAPVFGGAWFAADAKIVLSILILALVARGTRDASSAEVGGERQPAGGAAPDADESGRVIL